MNDYDRNRVELISREQQAKSAAPINLAGDSNRQQQQQHQEARKNHARPPSSSNQQRAKFVKSKSSPSSLTTHKFGLRPTPSPPRLIIDHQTGDIVESYPENPVYLRTYQPIEPTDDDDDDDDAEDDDTTQNQLDDSFASQATTTLGKPHSNLEDEDDSKQQAELPSEATMSQQFNHLPSGADLPHHRHGGINQQAVIPPPHAGKAVYFEPPLGAASNGASLFDQRVGSLAPSADLRQSSRERAQASFRRALNNLADSDRTDIAIVTEPEDYDQAGRAAGPRLAAQPVTVGQIRVTATSAAKGNALLAAQMQQQQQQQQQPHIQRHQSNNASKLYGQPPAVTATRDNRRQVYQPIDGPRGPARPVKSAAALMQSHQLDTIERPPTLEESSLYNFCYNLRVLLAIALSSLIIYLLAVPLYADCARYRPGHTYVSLITSCINLACIVIFSLFWCCKGITRSLYENVSGSAFMVSFYSILVCANLALAILFFFVDTCHHQRLMAGRGAALGTFASLTSGDDNLMGEPVGLYEREDAAAFATHYDRRRQEQRLALEAIESIEHLLSGRASAHKKSDSHEHSKRQAPSSLALVANDDGDDTTLARDPTVLDDQAEPEVLVTSTTTTTTTPSSEDLLAEQYGQENAHVLPKMSPWEAFWEYLKDEARVFRRNFRHFLMTYDLKFVGTLHALLAACFQYLAMKVAVVRSFFSARARHAYAATV